MSSTAEPRRHADRAAQFMPFAALTGYYDLVREQELVTEPRCEPSPEEAERISCELSQLHKGQLVRITHYDHDAYVTTEGIVARLDPTMRELAVVTRRVSFDDVWSIEQVG